MKLKKQCPECGGTEIYTTQSRYTGDNHLALLSGTAGFFGSKGHFDIYICGSCGFYQLFAPEEMLDDIKQKYQLVA